MRVVAKVHVYHIRVRVHQDPVRRGDHEVVCPAGLPQRVEREVLVSNPGPITEGQEVSWWPRSEGRFW